mmetsp:Transcript_9166/g.26432  ORF Transcript_9166/g.26432 Transcript_9166/m.26432 type:complete len:82 (+) Transcript_9166:125-370(+)
MFCTRPYKHTIPFCLFTHQSNHAPGHLTLSLPVCLPVCLSLLCLSTGPPANRQSIDQLAYSTNALLRGKMGARKGKKRCCD